MHRSDRRIKSEDCSNQGPQEINGVENVQGQLLEVATPKTPNTAVHSAYFASVGIEVFVREYGILLAVVGHGEDGREGIAFGVLLAGHYYCLTSWTGQSLT